MSVKEFFHCKGCGEGHAFFSIVTGLSRIILFPRESRALRTPSTSLIAAKVLLTTKGIRKCLVLSPALPFRGALWTPAFFEGQAALWDP